TGRGDAFGQLETKISFDQWPGFVPKQIVHLWCADPTEFEHVAKTFRGHERRVCTPTFEHGIGRDCGAVCHFRDGFARAAGFFKQATDRVENRPFEVGWRRW